MLYFWKLFNEIIFLLFQIVIVIALLLSGNVMGVSGERGFALLVCFLGIMIAFSIAMAKVLTLNYSMDTKTWSTMVCLYTDSKTFGLFNLGVVCIHFTRNFILSGFFAYGNPLHPSLGWTKSRMGGRSRVCFCKFYHQSKVDLGLSNFWLLALNWHPQLTAQTFFFNFMKRN